MKNFLFENPVGKVLFDLAVGGAIGAGWAAYALPGDANSKIAVGLIVGGAIKGTFGAAREVVFGALNALEAYKKGKEANP